jgi:Arc/MetJ family transcription regulator
MSVTLDDELVERVRSVLGVETKSEAIRVALKELLRLRRLSESLTHQGKIDLGIDQASLERMRASQ